jgi:hypothetical protein
MITAELMAQANDAERQSLLAAAHEDQEQEEESDNG